MGVFALRNFTKKHYKMKKAFCFDYFSMSWSKSKFFHVWFEFFPSYLIIGLSLQPWPQKFFPRFPFFYFGNLGKIQIRRGKILLQTWHGKKSKQNTIDFLYHCVISQIFSVLNFSRSVLLYKYSFEFDIDLKVSTRSVEIFKAKCSIFLKCL